VKLLGELARGSGDAALISLSDRAMDGGRDLAGREGREHGT
jgi:hypothetical protein